MCDCNLKIDKDFTYIQMGKMFLEYEKGKWYIEWACWDESGREEIFYCPKCGRKL